MGATEATLMAPILQNVGTTPWKEAQKYAFDIIADLNAWTTGWIEWNVLLDSSGGPTCIGPSHTGICTRRWAIAMPRYWQTFRSSASRSAMLIGSWAISLASSLEVPQL